MTTHFPTVPFAESFGKGGPARQQDVWPLALVVDDEPVITKTLKAILNRNGIAALCANNGTDALELASMAPPDLLITDYQMPGMNGIELAAYVHRIASRCQIILLSGNLRAPEMEARALNSGLEIVSLAKPVHPAKLLEHVNKGLLSAY